MDQYKIDLIKGFDIDAFFDNHSKYYEVLPEWVQNEIIKNEDKEYFICNEAQKEIDLYHLRESKIYVLSSLEMPILGVKGFNALEHMVKSGIKRDIEELEAKAQRGVSSKEMIYRKRLLEASELINFDLLEWLAGENPIPENKQLIAMQTLWETGVYQWIIKGNEGAKTTKEGVLNLPQKIMLLYEIGFFDLEKVPRTHTGKRDKIVALLLGEDITNTKKNINALYTANQKYNPKKYREEILRLLGLEEIADLF